MCPEWTCAAWIHCHDLALAKYVAVHEQSVEKTIDASICHVVSNSHVPNNDYADQLSILIVHIRRKQNPPQHPR
jgi:hypothetical protein